jgi:TP901 family phage tail tape measure protein
VPDAASTAVFRAVANFSSLISQSRAASTALAGTTTAANTAFGARTASMISARGRQMRQFGTTATVGVTAPLILAGGAMIHTYSEFEKTLTQAAGKADATKKEFKQMEDLAIRMGKQTMFSAGEAAGALDNLASLGFNARQSMQALPGVLLSASASGSDLALTADVVAKAINAFGLQAKDSTHLADVFAQASNTTALSMQGLADGLAHAGELGARFGFKVEDVVGMLGRLVDQGVPAASAGMAVRQAFVMLSAPTQEAGGLIKGLGLDIRDAAGNLKPLPDIVDEVSRALGAGSPGFKKMQETVGLSSDALTDWAKRNGMSTTAAKKMQQAAEQGGGAVRDYAMKTLFGTEGAKAMTLALNQGHPVVLDTQKDVKKLDALTDGLAKTMGVKAAKAWVKARTENGKFTAKGADAVRALGAMNKAADGTAKTFAKRLGKTTAFQIDQIKGSLETMAIVLVKQFAPAIKDALKWLTGVVNGFTDWAKAHPTMVKFLAIALLVIAAMGPLAFVIGSVVSVVGALVTVIGLLLSPIGLVVLAVVAFWTALVVAYKKVKWFHDAVDWYFRKAGERAAWLKSVIVPVFQTIGRIISKVWNSVIKPVLDAWWWTISQILVPILKSLWIDVVKPVMGLVWRMFRTAWAIIRPVLHAWWTMIKTVVGPALQWLWQKVIKPVFSSAGHHIRDVWQGFIQPALIAFRDGIQSLARGFHRAIDGINQGWSSIAAAARKPVNFVIDTVYNNGIRKWANKVFEFLGMGARLPTATPIGGFVGKAGTTGLPPAPIPGHARGGVVQGARGRSYDHTTVGMRAGEGVLVPEAVAELGGERGLMARNRAAEKRRRFGYRRGRGILHGFAGGGVFRPVSGGGYGGVHDQWTGFPAVDIGVGMGTPVHAVAPGRVTVSQDLATSYGHWIKIAHAGFQSLYAHLQNRLVGVGATVAGGQTIGTSDSTGNSTGPHLHFGVAGRSPLGFMNASTNYGGGGSLLGNIGNVIGGLVGAARKIPGWLAGAAGDATGWLNGKIAGSVSRIGGGQLGEMLKGVVGKIVPGVGDFIKGKMGGLLGGGGVAAASGGGPVRAIVQRVAASMGWGSGAQWAALSQIISHESGWNPNAQNPTSSAYGLFQFLDSTWAGVGGRKTSNPGQQASYGMRYIQQRYGSPVGAWDFWQRNHWYDDGGLLKPGWTGVFNGTRKPETVFTHRQMEVLLSSAEQSRVATQRMMHVIGVDAAGIPQALHGGDGRSVVINMPVYNPVAEPASDSGYRRLRRVAEMGLFANG